MAADEPDKRTAATLVRQYDILKKIRADFIKQGKLDGSATAEDVLRVLRKEIPAGIWS